MYYLRQVTLEQQFGRLEHSLDTSETVHERLLRFQNRAGTLYLKFKPEHMYWGVWETLRQLYLVALVRDYMRCVHVSFNHTHIHARTNNKKMGLWPCDLFCVDCNLKSAILWKCWCLSRTGGVFWSWYLVADDVFQCYIASGIMYARGISSLS